MKKSIIIASLALVSSYTAKAQIIVSDSISTTAESVGVFNSTLSGTSVENFSGMSAGLYKNVSWAGVGTINQVSLINDNQYGGVPGTSTYPVQSSSVGNGVKSTTISLNHESSYFGLYWSAGDAANTLSFYNGSTLVGQFTTKSLMDKLPSGYNGNPNPANLGQDKNEPFGFVNFSGLNGTSWDQIVLGNAASSGFESDNWTTRVNGWDPVVDGALPGTAVALVTTANGVSTSDLISSVTVKGASIAIASVNASGTTVTQNFVPAAPGAPAPPITACLAFAGVLLLQAIRRNKQAA